MNLKPDYSIGVVDYLGRFDTYFRPLIRQLAAIFPDKEIICILNGHHDVAAQMKYIREASVFLSSFKNIRYYSFDDPKSLAKCWNRIILMSKTDKNLILNDDLSVDPYFRVDLEKVLTEESDFFAINNSWSHFLISDQVISQVGWFDERFPGIGWEDGDYMLRMAEKNIKPVSLDCLGIKNFVAPPTNAGWTDIAAGSSKYSETNKIFFLKKWHFNQLENEPGKNYLISFFWNGDKLSGEMKAGMATPDFYPLALINRRGARSLSYQPEFIWYYQLKNLLRREIKNAVRIILRISRRS